MNVRTLRKLQRPIVWTLHDMWPFTGGCHHDDGCGRYSGGCGKCPVLASTWRIDLSSLGWQRKQRAYRGLAMHVVAPSRWLANLAANSPLLGQFPVSVIPNPINVQTFRPIDKRSARKMLGLPPDGQVVLFGALRATSMQSKGFPLLVDALQRFSRRGPKRDRYLLVLGASRPEQAPDCGMPSVYAGTLSDDVSLALSYSAADVYVTPSRQENLSNMVMESLSCGTPVVAFSIGGMPDMVEHLRNGYLAQPFEPEDLARGIEWVLEDEGRHAGLRARARDKALEEYESGKIAHRYRGLYEQVLEIAKAKGLGSQ